MCGLNHLTKGFNMDYKIMREARDAAPYRPMMGTPKYVPASCVFCSNEAVNTGNDLCREHLDLYKALKRAAEYAAKPRVKRSEVVNEYEACCYCGDPGTGPCCGEVHHKTVYELECGDIVRDGEVVFVD